MVIDYIEIEGIEGLVEISVIRRHLPEGSRYDLYRVCPVDDPRLMEMRVALYTNFNSDGEFIAFAKKNLTANNFLA